MGRPGDGGGLRRRLYGERGPDERELNLWLTHQLMQVVLTRERTTAMTNSATTSTTDAIQSYAHTTTKQSDEAPMIITRLSGWIDMGEPRATTPNWIVRTRMAAPAR
jgi:hypothetical protein